MMNTKCFCVYLAVYVRLTPTSYLTDVQDIADDVLRDFSEGLSPGDMEGVSGQGAGCEALWSSR